MSLPFVVDQLHTLLLASPAEASRLAAVADTAYSTACYGLDETPTSLLEVLAELGTWTAPADIIFVNATTVDRSELADVVARSRAAGAHVVVVAPAASAVDVHTRANLRATHSI